MSQRTALTAAVLLLAPAAAAQTRLFGVRSNGDVVLIDLSTGAGTVVARNDVSCGAAMSLNFLYGRGGEAHALYIGGGFGPTADQITVLEGWTGGGPTPIPTTGRPPGFGIRGLATLNGPTGPFYVILSPTDPQAQELLAAIDPATGVYTVIGPMGRSDLWALTGRDGVLNALGTDNGGGMYQIDPTTGAATFLFGGDFGGDDRAMTWLDGARLLICGANLRSVNLSSGITTVIGPTGFDDIHGLAVTRGCYANCIDGPPPVLSVSDFICFQGTFAAGGAYANCDLSSTPPVLNISDFICFMTKFAGDCGP
jgi:hypothetical protein